METVLENNRTFAVLVADLYILQSGMRPENF